MQTTTKKPFTTIVHKQKDYMVIEYNHCLTPCEKTDIANYYKSLPQFRNIRIVTFKRVS